MSALDYPSLRTRRSSPPNYIANQNTFSSPANLYVPTVNVCNSASGTYPPPTSLYHTNQSPFPSGRRRDSTTDDEYDADEFDDDSSALVTPPMSSPLIKRKEGESKSKSEGETVHWNVNGADETRITNGDKDGLVPKLNEEGDERSRNVGDPPSYQTLLDANSFTDPLPPEDSVVLSATSEIVSPANNSATLPSPGLQRSDSVKFCRSSNGNALRSGHGLSVAGMAGSNPAAGVNRPARRVPSLKLKRLHVLGSRGGGGGGGVGTGGAKLIPGDTGGIAGVTNNTGNLCAPTVALSGHVNPSITITLDSDSDSVYSDYLSPEINYRAHEAKVQFLGDENSLYGTPKEELPSTGDTLATDTLPKPSSTTTYLREQIMNFFQPSDNKLAMKLFGNKNALIKEKMRHKRVGNWVIHPCSNFRFYWDLFMLVLLIANLIILPVAISFFNDDLSTHWIVFNCISDTVFFLDIVINFRTGIILNDFADEIILDPKLIARQYIKTWFFLDLLSSIPMDYIFLMWDSEADFNQLFHAGTTKPDTNAYWKGEIFCHAQPYACAVSSAYALLASFYFRPSS